MSKTKIRSIEALEVLDSRANPTVRAYVRLSGGVVGTASVPSGASTGIHEAHELRDGDEKRYRGKGCRKAVRAVNRRIAPALRGLNAAAQRQIDREMIHLDGMDNKSKLGANAILAVSLACARAAAMARAKPLYEHIRRAYRLREKAWRLPMPLFNIMNGGLHADSDLDIQEFIAIPVSAGSMKERVRMGAEVFHALGDELHKAGKDRDLGNEGGYAPYLGSNERALKIIVQSIRSAGYEPGKDVKLGMDVAASEFYDRKEAQYRMPTDNRVTDAPGMIKLMKQWARKYPLWTIEDPLDQDDWEGWQLATRELGKKHVIIGDDLFVTNVQRLRQGIENQVANAILIKVNQIGTLTETMDAIALARKHGYQVVISHRSGETCDTTIADLAVAVNAEFIKTGSPARGERTAKYNRLLEIEHEIKK